MKKLLLSLLVISTLLIGCNKDSDTSNPDNGQITEQTRLTQEKGYRLGMLQIRYYIRNSKPTNEELLHFADSLYQSSYNYDNIMQGMK